MQSFFGLAIPELESKGALHTAREIVQQPDIWHKILEGIIGQSSELQHFLQQACSAADNIILTGAGTSAYIGLSLQGSFFRHTNILTRAVATTDLVAHPQDYFHRNKTPLIISFARSGNSPESCAALELADELSAACYHLVITCNSHGSLARWQSRHPQQRILLPPECNDKSLAMTSSYSGMLFAGTLLTRLHHLPALQRQASILFTYGKSLLRTYTPVMQQIAAAPFRRAVFLGDGAFFGTATEGQLKLQELTNGKVICKSDSFLGFRHGPKAVIDESTLVIYLFSNSPYVLRYEKDLVLSMKQGNKALMEIGVLPANTHIPELDYLILTNDNQSMLEEDLLCVCNIIPLQLLAFFTALKLGIHPDNPSDNGAITRVVEGVSIYPLKA
ncbi:SIS domain-containing protein [Chitinophaga oryzae]|uniref:SIS domain-containing protein n=1 Tax=Chitinophaga oryzae TaxID=2725414 RepID=A0AAE7D5G5_9BACT|nr:SIS domain-containing protein [Chitinophaga oryzae]QJB30613.1 SIS domain-containing protein [Chitinophaga oryzae]